MKKIIEYLQNLKFVRKIQFGFGFIAFIFLTVAANDYLQIVSMESAINSIEEDVLKPQDKISGIYSNFQKIQFIMLKFAVTEFQANFAQDEAEYQRLKKIVDTDLEELATDSSNAEMMNNMTNVRKIWSKYKNEVADAIVSAAAVQQYDFAAIIAAENGETVGKEMNAEFEKILGDLKSYAVQINEEVSSDVQSAQLWMLVGVIFGSAAIAFCVFILVPNITKPINRMKEVLNEFSIGNYEVSLGIYSKDEFGELAQMMRKLREATQEKVRVAQDISNGITQRITPASEQDSLSHAFNKEVETIESLISEAEKLIEANQNGDLSIRGDVTKFSGGWRRIIEGVNSILDTIVAPINEASKVLNVMAQGDFTFKMNGEYKGDYLKIKEDVNKLNYAMNQLIGRVAESTTELASAASEISASTEEMAAGANEQRTQTADVAASIEQMIRTINENTRHVTSASLSAEEAGSKAHEGGRVVIETIEGINRIAEIVLQSSSTIQNLGKSSDQIGEIVQVIDDIADQTNLLALNAAIEAARAGEQGRGFAVVADEVRKLAERTTKATKEIAQKIKQIQKDTSGAVVSIQQGAIEVEKGKTLAGKAGEALNDIILHSEKLVDVISQLAAASEEQSATGEQINLNVEAINLVTQQAADGTHQISRAAEDLYNLTGNLQQLINHFRLDIDVAQEESPERLMLY